MLPNSYALYKIVIKLRYLPQRYLLIKKISTRWDPVELNDIGFTQSFSFNAMLSDRYNLSFFKQFINFLQTRYNT